jgi:outer membrane protein assembly factor BamD (BamD/ComL family)
VRAIAPVVKPASSAGSTSAAEIAMLDQARSTIDQGDPAHGLSILDAYATRFPHPVMGPEASILRIEALVKTGDRAGAKREGDAFLHANPASPYAPRIKSLLGTSNP